MNFRLHLLLFLLLLVNHASASKLNKVLNTVSFNEVFGLSEQTIYDAFECEGGIYFGSSNGLYFFDGDSIQNYRMQGYPTEYTNIQMDPEGRVWFSNFNGQIFYLENKSIQLFSDQSDKTDIIIGFELCFYPKVILTDENSIYYIDVSNPNSSETEMLNSRAIHHTPDDSCLFAILENQGNYTVVSINNQFQLDTLGNFELRKSGKLQFIHFKDQLAICNIGYSQIDIYSCKLPSLELEKVLEIPTNLYSFNQFSKVNDTTLAYLDKDGYQLICTKPWDTNFKKLHLTSLSASKYLPTKGQYTILTSLNKGVHLIPELGFQHLPLSDFEIGSFTFSEDKLFFLDLNNQLWKLDLNSFELSKLRLKLNYDAPLFYDPNQNKILFGDGKIAYDISNDKKVNNELFKFKNLVRAFGKLHGTYSHLLYTQTKSEFKSFRNKRCNQINFDKVNQHLYVDFIDGLHFADSTMNFMPIKADNARIFPKCIEAKKGGGVWVMGSSGKLWSIEKGAVKLTKTLDRTFNQIVEDINGNLYLSNDLEVIKIDIISKEITEYTYRNGLLKKTIKGIKLFKEQLLVINPDAIQFLDVDHKRQNTTSPSLRIESAIVNGKARSLDELSSLTYQENQIGFHFSSYHLSSMGEEIINYRFKNRDSSWSKLPGKIGLLEFPQLSPGDYSLQLKVCSVEGFCNAIKTVDFTIEKAWYNTGWFYFLVFLILILIVFFISRSIIKHNLYLEKLLRDKETAEKERQLSKLKAIQAQMNPHFVFNALNSIQDYILANQRELASEYLADFADLVRSYLKQTQKDFIDIAEEVETLHEYLKLEKLRLGNSFEYEIKYANSAEKIKEIAIPVMLIQPFVENSIKHGLLPKKGEKRLLILFELNENEKLLRIIVSDNGVGMDSTQKSQLKPPGLSFGNQAVADKINLLNKHHQLNLSVKYQEGFIDSKVNGTTVILHISIE